MAFFLLLLAVVVVLSVVQILLTPKPKTPKPPSTTDFDGPTADADRAIPVVFGTITVKSPNCLDFLEKSVHSYQVKA